MTADGTISLVGSERSGAADRARRWLSDPALRAVLEAFGGPTPDPQDPASVAAVAAWTARHWDFRRGAERRAADRQCWPHHWSARWCKPPTRSG